MHVQEQRSRPAEPTQNSVRILIVANSVQYFSTLKQMFIAFGGFLPLALDYGSSLCVSNKESFRFENTCDESGL